MERRLRLLFSSRTISLLAISRALPLSSTASRRLLSLSAFRFHSPARVREMSVVSSCSVVVVVVIAISALRIPMAAAVLLLLPLPSASPTSSRWSLSDARLTRISKLSLLMRASLAAVTSSVFQPPEPIALGGETLALLLLLLLLLLLHRLLLLLLLLLLLMLLLAQPVMLSSGVNLEIGAPKHGDMKPPTGKHSASKAARRTQHAMVTVWKLVVALVSPHGPTVAPCRVKSAHSWH